MQLLCFRRGISQENQAIFERELLECFFRGRELVAYQYDGFWQCYGYPVGKEASGETVGQRTGFLKSAERQMNLDFYRGKWAILGSKVDGCARFLSTQGPRLCAIMTNIKYFSI